MEREYKTGTLKDVRFFVGREIEKTPAYGKLTLFVTGVQPLSDISFYLNEHPGHFEHIFFGANHSFNPTTSESWKSWEDMIKTYLDLNYFCSLDIPLSAVEMFNDSCLNEYNNFIPQIRVPIPYVKLWNYNTMVKIDDRDFNSTNPGIWTHSLHDLMSRDQFTDWSEYKDDQVLK